jgi:hypothetical protein
VYKYTLSQKQLEIASTQVQTQVGVVSIEGTMVRTHVLWSYPGMPYVGYARVVYHSSSTTYVRARVRPHISCCEEVVCNVPFARCWTPSLAGCASLLTTAATSSWRLQAPHTMANSQELPWELVDLIEPSRAPSKEKLAVYLKANATLAFLTKHKLQNPLKSVLKNRKLAELNKAYEEFMETKPFSTDAERAAEQGAITDEVLTTAAAEAAKPAAVALGDVAATAATGDSGGGAAADEDEDAAEGVSGGAADGKKKKKNRKKKKQGSSEPLTITSVGNGKTGTTMAHSLNLGGFTDSYVRWGQVRRHHRPRAGRE